MTRNNAARNGVRLCGSLLASMLLLAGAAGPIDAADDCTVSAEAAALDAEEAYLLLLLNQYRRDNDLPFVEQSSTLRQAAAWMSEDRAARGIAGGHIDTFGRDAGSRLPDCGYAGPPAFAENLYSNERDTDAAVSVFASWQGSPGHNAAMLDPRFHYAGVARACSEAWCFWTLDLGSDPSGLIEEAPAPSDERSISG